MKYVVTSEQMQKIDRSTISDIGISELVLMERAATKVFEKIKAIKGDRASICIVTGSGNNAGDGFAVARMAAEEGMDTLVVMLASADNLSPTAKLQYDIVSKLNVEMIRVEKYIPTDKYRNLFGRYDVLVDAIFGTGLSRNIEAEYKEMIAIINESKCFKVAVDIPSGVNATNGAIMGIAVKADATVTFGLVKLGLLLYPSKEYIGTLSVENIGFPKAVVDKIMADEKNRFKIIDNYKNLLPLRTADANKGNFGKTLIVAGSEEMCGAAYLCAAAAYRIGAGLVKILTVKENKQVLQTLLPEAIITTYEAEKGIINSESVERIIETVKWAEVIAIGSGLGTNSVSRMVFDLTLDNTSVPIIVDADGIMLLKGKKLAGKNLVITPHLKEMAKYIDNTVEYVKNNKVQIINDFVNTTGQAIVLKDAVTYVADTNNEIFINTTGNESMAKGGSGDVLTGIIAGLIAQHMTVGNAAKLGVYLHGSAGDVAKKQSNQYSVLARDIIEALSHIDLAEEI